MTPAETIRQARLKATTALTKQCQLEMARICNEFSAETGLSIYTINVDIIPVSKLGYTPEIIVNHIDIRYEVPEC